MPRDIETDKDRLKTILYDSHCLQDTDWVLDAPGDYILETDTRLYLAVDEDTFAKSTSDPDAHREEFANRIDTDNPVSQGKAEPLVIDKDAGRVEGKSSIEELV